VKKTVLRFGIISGVILSVMMGATIPFADTMGYDRAMVVGYTTMLLAFLFVFFGIRSYRENVGGGKVTFGRALKVGILITCIASAFYVVTWQVMSYAFMPDFMEKYSEHIISQERAAGASEQALAEKQTEMARFTELYKNPFIRAGMTLMEVLPVGVIVTLASAAILRRRRDDPLPA
jgi:hypothetical protein